MARITNAQIMDELQKLASRVVSVEAHFNAIAVSVDKLSDRIEKIDGILRGESLNGGLLSRQKETDTEIRVLIEENKRRKEREFAIILLLISNILTVVFDIIRNWR